LSAAARRALVSGASSGIGEATARLLARSGYRVALLARRTEALERVASEIEQGGGEPPLILPCDLTDNAQVERSLERLGEEFGGLDLLVNNAGIGYRARVEELERTNLRRVFDTNVLGLLWMCKSALPHLRKGHRPVVVNIASVVGRRGIPGQAAYAASKAAVCSIGEALRLEWAVDGIRIATLNPALTATGFFEAQQNPAGLSDPDTSEATPSIDVAQHVLQLDRNPEPERCLRWKWRLLAVLSVLRPRLADRLLANRLGGDWTPPQA
jgi:NAD(P)-dependent dehydrogenase (short-subunit alcohol dehydrogenase family)